MAALVDLFTSFSEMEIGQPTQVPGMTVMTFLDLKYPVLQAPMGSVASARLAARVSNAGGMGSLALTWDEPRTAVEKVRLLKAETNKLFFVNYVLSFPPESLEAVLQAGVPAVTFSWGQPAALVSQAHKHGAMVGIQVGTVDGAKQALDSQADFLICQGVEAGGTCNPRHRCPNCWHRLLIYLALSRSSLPAG